MEEVSDLSMPLYLAPPYSWFKQMNDSGIVHVSIAENFDSDARYNRILFAGPHGKQQFSIPLVAESKKGIVSDIRISYAENWQNQLINALRTAYGKSPFYEYYDYKLEPVLKTRFTYLRELNMEILNFMIDAYKLKTEIEYSQKEPVEVNMENEHKDYYQVFADRNGFISGLSLLDHLFNEGWDLDWKKGI